VIKTNSEFYIAVDNQEKKMSTTTTAQQQLTFMLEGMDQLLDADNFTFTSHSDDDSTVTSLESDFYNDSDVEIISNSSTRRRTTAPPRSRRWLQEEIELKLSLERSDSLDNFRRRRRRSQQSLQEKIRRDPFGPLEEDSLHLSRSRVPLSSSRIVRREQPHQNDDEEPWVEGEITIIPLGAPLAHMRAFANDQPMSNQR
jgi:hypothetical protein